jgi:hypothetical protein
MESGRQALNEFRNNYHTGVDLIHHPPNDVPISDESLTEFAYSLELTSSELNHLKTVAEKVLAETIQPLPNSDRIQKIILSECHLCNCGRNDSGFDLVVLMPEGEDLTTMTEHIKGHVQKLTSTSAGRHGGTPTLEGQTESVETHEAGTPHAKAIHFEHDGVHVNIATGHRYGKSEEENRMAIWNKIADLDQKGQLKKIHLDQFAVDLYESMTMFMNNQVIPESLGEPGTEKFIQGALRLARAWRQCCLSSRDVQFAPIDVWLIMLHAVHVEVTSHGQVPKETPKGSAVGSIRRAVRELVHGRGVTGKIQAGGRELSMKSVIKQFLNQLANIEQVHIQFADFYDQSKIPSWMKSQRPLIHDPVCPYRNTLYDLHRNKEEHLHRHVTEDIKRHAQESLKMLDDPNATLTKLFHLPAYKKRGA